MIKKIAKETLKRKFSSALEIFKKRLKNCGLQPINWKNQLVKIPLKPSRPMRKRKKNLKTIPTTAIYILNLTTLQNI